MKFLVTGATGFIGNHIVSELLKRGYEIVATSKDIEKAKRCEWFSQVQYIPFDFNESEENLFRFFHEPDHLIHLSWEGLPNYNKLFHLEKNLFSNYMFLKNIVEHGLKDMVVTGTCFEYGMQNGVLTEDMETKPNNPYSLAKDTLRKFLQQLQKKCEFDLKWVRLFYMYGEGQSPYSILSQLKRALDDNQAEFNMSGGEQIRDYLPVKKVAEYIVNIATQKKITGIINCCSGEGITIKKLVENYIKENKLDIKLNLGYHPYLDYEPMEFWGDNEKLKNILELENESTD